jgi:hypothetical protein
LTLFVLRHLGDIRSNPPRLVFRGQLGRRTLAGLLIRKIGAKGGENSRVNLPKRLVKRLARKAALARWRKYTT